LNTTCVIIRNSKGQYLGVSRKNDHTSFGLPGGKCDGCELPVLAAVRELKEETGLNVCNIELFDVRSYEFTKDCYRGNDVVYCYVIKPFGPIVLPTDEDRTNNNEGIVRWVEKERLFEGCFGDYNREILTLFECTQ
jgi:8-oxo-dGTP pyrophosphatase MutT (NUDIX family)